MRTSLYAVCIYLIILNCQPITSAQCTEYAELKDTIENLKLQICGDVKPSPPPSGYTQQGGRWYKLFKSSRLNYEEATKRCQSDGGRLASTGIRTDRENVAVRILQPGRPGPTWIGLDDLSEVGKWVWSDNVVSIHSDTPWSPSEPNNLGGERCVEISPGRSWRLNNIPCGWKRSFLCEI